MNMQNARYRAALEAVKKNSPRIRVNQRWVVRNHNDVVMRRIRILAPHPDGGWIFKDEPAKLRRVDYSRLGVTPELNLRFVFTLEK